MNYIALRECDLSKFHERSEAIKSPEFIRREYSKFAKKMYAQQTSPFRNKESFIFKVFNKLSANKLRSEERRGGESCIYRWGAGK